MKILADQNIPFAVEAFSQFGEVELFSGRDLTHDDVQAAEILFVRSVTQVNQSLLQGTPVKFVGSATIGTDHIDLDYLAQHSIGFANAPGSNATSASEYVLAALFYYTAQTGSDFKSKTVGIVGYGNVGSRVANLLRALGITLKIYDPPKQAEENNKQIYCDWQAILDCDIVTAHVPLTRTGPCPTYHMFNSEFFSALKKHALFINTSRGKAVDEQALLARIETGKPITLILDVWDNEPAISKTLLQQTLIATPHIAGYAYDGKLRGTEMILHAACEFFNMLPDWSADAALGGDQHTLLTENQLDKVVSTAYNIIDDDKALRKIIEMDAAQSAMHFDALRKNYPQRREFSHYRLKSVPDADQLKFKKLGFTI